MSLFAFRIAVSLAPSMLDAFSNNSAYACSASRCCFRASSFSFVSITTDCSRCPILSRAFSSSTPVVADECFAAFPSETSKCASLSSFSRWRIRFVYSAATVAAVAYGMDSIAFPLLSSSLFFVVKKSLSSFLVRRRCKRADDSSILCCCSSSSFFLLLFFFLSSSLLLLLAR